jgi:DNA (cytosine-5)-methyltransferase 1
VGCYSALSLFSGIGGFDLAAQWAGFSIQGQIEIDPYCRRVLAKYWPDVARWGDIKKVGADDILSSSDGIRPALLMGGFPCQDISRANWQGQGLAGARSGLFFEFARLIGDLQPSYVLLENVPALTTRGGEQVLASLAALGYDASWGIVPAAAIGAPHKRERFWLVAHPHGTRSQGAIQESTFFGRIAETLAHPNGPRCQGGDPQGGDPQGGLAPLSHQKAGRSPQPGMGGDAYGLSPRLDGAMTHLWPAGQGTYQHPWEPPRTVPPRAVPNRPARLHALGNAIVPQVAYPILKLIYNRLKESQP